MNNLLNTLIWYFFTDILNNFLCILSIPISIQLSLDVIYLWEKIAFLCEQPKHCLWFVNGMVMTFSLEIDDFQRGAFFFFFLKSSSKLCFQKEEGWQGIFVFHIDLLSGQNWHGINSLSWYHVAAKVCKAILGNET